MTEADAYGRGIEAGKIEQRLDGHDKHFERINGSLEKMAVNLAELNMSIQQLVDSGKADRATVLTTAAALKAADDARRDRGEARWTPFQRGIAIIATLAAVAGIIVAIITRH
jgi:hypothetical protein